MFPGFVIGCPGYRTCSVQYQLNSLGSIRPCCLFFFNGAGNYNSNTQAITVKPGTIYSWVVRVHMQVKYLAQGHSGTLWQPRPVPKTSQSKVAGHSHHHNVLHMEYTLLDVGTLRVVTARELVVLSGTLCPTPIRPDSSAIYVIMQAMRDSQSPMLKGEKLISTTQVGIEPLTINLADDAFTCQAVALLLYIVIPPRFGFPSKFNSEQSSVNISQSLKLSV